MKLLPFHFLIAFLLFSVPIIAEGNGSHPDFSGRWELVKGESDFGKMPPPVNMTLVSEKREGYLHSLQTTQTPQGDQVSENDWFPDGKRHTYEKPVPGYSITRWEGNTLLSERRSNDGHYRQTVKLSMESDGKKAVETVSEHTPNGDNRMRLVWQRQ